MNLSLRKLRMALPGPVLGKPQSRRTAAGARPSAYALFVGDLRDVSNAPSAVPLMFSLLAGLIYLMVLWLSPGGVFTMADKYQLVLLHTLATCILVFISLSLGFVKAVRRLTDFIKARLTEQGVLADAILLIDDCEEHRRSEGALSLLRQPAQKTNSMVARLREVRTQYASFCEALGVDPLPRFTSAEAFRPLFSPQGFVLLLATQLILIPSVWLLGMSPEVAFFLLLASLACLGTDPLVLYIDTLLPRALNRALFEVLGEDAAVSAQAD